MLTKLTPIEIAELKYLGDQARMTARQERKKILDAGHDRRARKVLEFIYQYIGECDRPPTIREIEVGCGIRGRATVMKLLSRLERHRAIRRDRKVARGIVVLDSGWGDGEGGSDDE